MSSEKHNPESSDRPVSRDDNALSSKVLEKADQSVKNLIKNLTDEEKQEFGLFLVRYTEESFSGSVSSPKAMAAYKEILSNLPDRLMSLVEKQQQIHQDGQTGMIINERKRIHGATWVAMGLICVAGLATWKGNTYIAVPLGFVGIIAGILRFLYRWWQPKSDRHTE